MDNIADTLGALNTTTQGGIDVIYQVDSACQGSNNGTIDTLFIVGGIAPYTFWKDGAPTALPITGLAPGTYTIRARDFNGNETEQDVTVFESLISGAAIGGLITIGGNDPDFVGYDSMEVKLLDYDGITDGYNTTVESFRFGIGSGGPYNYLFHPVAVGNYKVLAKIRTLNTITTYPTYFGQTLYWSEADSLNIPSGCPDRLANIDLLVSEYLEPDSGRINGYIDFGVFKTQNIHTNNDPIPLIDVVVEKDSITKFITNANDSDNDGVFEYQFRNLPLVCYDSIYVNLPGVRMYTSYYPCLTINDSSLINLNFCADTTGTSTETQLDICPSGIPIGISLPRPSSILISPNPNQGRFEIKSHEVIKCLSILDILGNKVLFKETSGSDGLKIEMLVVPGLYFVELIKNGKPQTVKLAIK